MQTCFVIQPFDGGKFDKRFNDVFRPAILEAGLTPYRVDQDPSVVVPIEDIERGIRESALCLAEISIDNPNVWFELGYAIACGKSVVLVCSMERTKFPFDVQHRSILRYSSDSSSDFEDLKSKIIARIEALLSKDAALETLTISSGIALVEGLNPQEMGVLVSLAGNIDTPGDSVSPHILRKDMQASGFTKMAAIVALKSLSLKLLIEAREVEDFNGDRYQAYSLTERGWEWIMANQERFTMVKGKPIVVPDDDDLPF